MMALLLCSGELTSPDGFQISAVRTQTNLEVAYSGLYFAPSCPGSFYTHRVSPPEMTKGDANHLILEAMSSTIYGPWILPGDYP